jgi:fatty-acyl-CoA synthase
LEVPLSPLEFARRSRRLYGSREAVVDGKRRFTYEQFLERCDRWSSALQRLGVSPGDRVAAIACNSAGLLEAFYAVPQIGAVLVPINYRLSGDEVAYILEHSGARVVCALGDSCELVDRIREKTPGVQLRVAFGGARPGWLDYEAEMQRADPGFRPAPMGENDLLTLNYTSGTTARPKGVMITHRNAYLNTIGTLLHHPMTVEDRYLWTLPMFHANGWTFVWTVTAAGAAHVCIPRPEPAAVFESVAREAVTMLCAAPTVLIGIAGASEELRRGARRGVRVLTAGAPPAPATIERVEGELGWTVTQAYGLTETSPFITICEPRPEHDGLDTAGRAAVKARQGVELLTSGEVRVVDDHDREVPHDGETIGEIVVRGNVVMEGYYRDPEATAQALRGGWFHSGDAAVVHPDGYVEIRDRFKDVIISGGENVSSIAVEGALLRHPAVQEAAVIGVPHEKWGEVPQAFVIRRPGAVLTEEELLLFARERLAGFQTPKGVTFLDELPKTATGKVQKFVLRGGRPAIARQ